jgi:hypothetical protein
MANGASSSNQLSSSVPNDEPGRLAVISTFDARRESSRPAPPNSVGITVE